MFVLSGHGLLHQENRNEGQNGEVFSRSSDRRIWGRLQERDQQGQVSRAAE